MLRDKVFFFCWTNMWDYFPVLQVNVVFEGQEEGCEVTKAEGWEENNKLSRSCSQIPWWLTNQSVNVFSCCLVSEICQVYLHVRGNWVTFCEILWSLEEERCMKFSVFQYPIRPASMTYDDVTHLSAKIKPKQQKVGHHLSPVCKSLFMLCRMYFRKARCAVELF